MPFLGPRRGAHGIFTTKGYNVVYNMYMWRKLKNLFRKKPKTADEKIKTLEQVLKKIPKKANETAEERRKRIKVNKRINEARA